jgi:hypothetical protein
MNLPMGVRTALMMTGRSMMIAPPGFVCPKYKYKRRVKRGQFCSRPLFARRLARLESERDLQVYHLLENPP